METDYNVSAATRVIITGIALGNLFFSACRWQRRLGFVFGVLALMWAGLFPFYWSDWFGTPRAIREYGDWRTLLGLGAAVLPLVFVSLGYWRHEKSVA